MTNVSFTLLKIVEKSEKSEKSFPLGCTRNLGLGFTILFTLLKIIEKNEKT